MEGSVGSGVGDRRQNGNKRPISADSVLVGVKPGVKPSDPMLRSAIHVFAGPCVISLRPWPPRSRLRERVTHKRLESHPPTGGSAGTTISPRFLRPPTLRSLRTPRLSLCRAVSTSCAAESRPSITRGGNTSRPYPTDFLHFAKSPTTAWQKPGQRPAKRDRSFANAHVPSQMRNHQPA